MIEAVLLLAVIVLSILLHDTRGRLKGLEGRVGDHGRPSDEDEREAAASVAVARDDEHVELTSVYPDEHTQAPEEIAAVGDQPGAAFKTIAQRFEAFVGGRLPIWTGGIALAFAGFFLVRYSIELGLLGPGARSLIAAAFGFAMLGLSEFGPRVPRIGGFVGSDERIAQSLAGAGIATLYGTLYMASELYGLIGIGVAFVLVVIVTVLALALALRHGPPTAIMGLTGGYLAPYVAGLPSTSLTSTLLYLGVFTLGLMGLAVHRRWSWLALAASAASLIWTGSLIVVAEPAQSHGIGGLIVIAVIAALIAFGRAGGGRFADLRWAMLTIAAAAIELVAIVARSGFSSFGWLLYAALSAATIVLAWRDPKAMPGVWIALALAIIALFASFLGEVVSVARLIPALGIALLFGIPAQLLTRASAARRNWAAIAVFAPLAPLLITMACFAAPHGDWAWALACIVVALPIGAVLRLAGPRGDAVAEAALLVLAVALVGFAVPVSLYPSGYAALFAVGAWLRRGEGELVPSIAATALVIAGVAMALRAIGLGAILFESLDGATLHYHLLPLVGTLALALLLPGLIVAAVAWQRWARGGVAIAAATVATLAIGGFAYALAKQPLGIDTTQAFVAYGFGERTVLTQIVLCGAWLAARRDVANWGRIAVALAAVGLLRFVYFDLLLLNPLALRQAVGSWPLLNAATLDCAGVALWCWLLADRWAERWAKMLRYASLGAMTLAVLVSVRQGVHGTIIAGQAIETGENYLYSAALLLLALAWLAVGIVRHVALLRIAGLGLLTAVTLKVFLVDAAVLDGLLRVVSFLGLGAALIGIGWAYGKIASGQRERA